MNYKYKQKLPAKVEKDLDAYIERIKNIQWFKPSPDLKRETVDIAVKAALSAFGIKASIEYRPLKTPEDYDAARDAARDAAWDAAWGAARDAARDAAWDAAWDAAGGAVDILATHTDTYKLQTPFVRLMDIWELGMYPCGVIGGKFVVYTPVDFNEQIEEKKSEVAVELPKTLIINGQTYLRA